jgi:hypothetical protein
MSGMTWFRLAIAGSCLIGLAAGAVLAGVQRDVNIFYSAGGAVTFALFMSWMFEIWNDEKRDPEALAKKLADGVLTRLMQDTPVSPSLQALNPQAYKQLEQQVQEVIQAGL